MKDRIQTYVQLFSGNVELTIAVTENLKVEEGNLKNFGCFKISDGSLGGSEIYWDNIEFFQREDYKLFKAECEEDIKDSNSDLKQTFKNIKRLLKRANKINILTDESK